MTEPLLPRGRLNELTAIRDVAALMVVLFHAQQLASDFRKRRAGSHTQRERRDVGALLLRAERLRNEAGLRQRVRQARRWSRILAIYRDTLRPHLPTAFLHTVRDGDPVVQGRDRGRQSHRLVWIVGTAPAGTAPLGCQQTHTCLASARTVTDLPVPVAATPEVGLRLQNLRCWLAGRSAGSAHAHPAHAPASQSVVPHGPA